MLQNLHFPFLFNCRGTKRNRDYRGGSNESVLHKLYTLIFNSCSTILLGTRTCLYSSMSVCLIHLLRLRVDCDAVAKCIV